MAVYPSTLGSSVGLRTDADGRVLNASGDPIPGDSPQRAWPRIKALGFDERFKRMWEYYLAYCQVGFDVRALDVGLYKLVRPANS